MSNDSIRRMESVRDNTRPNTLIELLYEVLKSIERSRGSPEEHAARVLRLVIWPLYVILLLPVIGAVAGAFLLSGKDIDLGGPIGSVTGEWLIGGAGALVLASALAWRAVRRKIGMPAGWLRRGAGRHGARADSGDPRTAGDGYPRSR